MRSINTLVFFLLSPMITFGASEIAGKVISVIDGNTFELKTDDNEVYEIILFGIDCPELGQPFAEEAKAQLEKIILKKTLIVTIQGKNRYGIRLGTFLVKNKVDPRSTLLEKGLAWTAERNAEEELERIRIKAAEWKVGIWKEDAPIPPWIYRRTQSMLTPKSS